MAKMDSITNLRDITFYLLERYTDAQSTVIWEYSGQIAQDLEELEQIKNEYAKVINELYKDIIEPYSTAALDGEQNDIIISLPGISFL